MAKPIDFSSKDAKEESIARELKRLKGLFQNIPADKKNTTIGLLEQAAFMRVGLAELNNDLNENGYWEMFSQGDQTPYQRKRPAAEIYIQMQKSYLSVIKQLNDLLPKDTAPQSTGDGFDEFVTGRDE